MTRHFLGLYILIVVTLAAVSWGQDELLQRYNMQEVPEDKASAAVMTAVQDQFFPQLESERSRTPSEFLDRFDSLHARSGELFKSMITAEIAKRVGIEP